MSQLEELSSPQESEELPVSAVGNEQTEASEMDNAMLIFSENVAPELGKSILPEVSNEVSSSRQPQNAVREETDEEFLERFQSVSVLQTSTKKERVKGPQNIAGYIIDSEASSILSQDAISQENCAFKRPRDPNNEETYTRAGKRVCKDENDNETTAHDMPTQSALLPIFGSVIKLEDDSNDSISDDDFQLEDDDENEVDPTDGTSSEMAFPDVMQGIDFDVEKLLKLPNQGFRTGLMGEKKLQQYWREKRLVLECIKELHNCLKNAPTDIVEMDPEGLTISLMPHQKQAMKWMKWREMQQPCSGGILADEMGLGKTLQMIALIVAIKNEKKARMLREDPDALRTLEYDDAEVWGSIDIQETYEGQTLVICPTSLLEQWYREIDTKCDTKVLSCYTYHGPEQKLVAEGKLIKYDVVITTYNTVAIEYKNWMERERNKDSRLFNINWDRIVLDEAHYIRNHRGKVCQAVCELKGKKKWAITGTPIQNRENDFFPLLKYLNCVPFNEYSVWNKWVNNKKALGNKRLIIITKSLMLRRTKEELIEKKVIKPLPEKYFVSIQVELDKEELVVYQKLLLYSQGFFMEYLKQKEKKSENRLFPNRYFSSNSLIAQHVPKKLSRMMRTLLRNHSHQYASDYLLVLIIRLRQLCCHPALIKGMLDKEDTDLDDVEGPREIQRMDASILDYINKMMDDDGDEEDEDCDDFQIDEYEARSLMTSANPLFKDERQSSKVRAILKTIQDILNVGEKVVVVSQWTSFLQIIANNLAHMPDAKFGLFSGKTKIRDRQMLVDRINDYDDDLNVLLLSLSAGAAGLNLVGANHLLVIDNHWNPQLELQAHDRLHRFGQFNNVHIYRFICINTIEEKIKELQEKKLQIARNVLEGKVDNNLTLKDLAVLFS